MQESWSVAYEPQRKVVKRLWRKACQHEGIDPKEKFVVFSNDNPFNKDYNYEMGKYLNMVRPFFE
jgi:hypothetical protein